MGEQRIEVRGGYKWKAFIGDPSFVMRVRSKTEWYLRRKV
jgi:hypothetical protein